MNTGTPVPDSYYERIDEHRYKPTAHAGGAWDPDEQHFSPLGGLVVHAIDRHLAGRPDSGLATARISYDILGRPALDECEIRVETIRPGRTIELIEAVVLIADRPVVRARAWLLATVDTSAVAGGPDDRLTPPQALTPWPMASLWPGGYIASLDVRPLAPPRAGRTTAWISTPTPSSPTSPAARSRPTSPSSTPPTASPYDSRPLPGCTPTST